MYKILLIDDDERLGDLLSDYFNRYGLKLTHYTSPVKGIQAIELLNPDCIILDVMMPEMDGFEACKKIRMDSEIPIIMLTARGDVMDRVVGLELGADDYLPKPFEPRELVARINSIVKRFHALPKIAQASIGDGELIFKDLVISVGGLSAQLKGVDLNLTGSEAQLLILFAKSPEKIFSRDDIVNYMNGVDSNVFSRSVDILVSRLRSKLGDNKQDFIKTIRGSGYKFVGEK